MIYPYDKYSQFYHISRQERGREREFKWGFYMFYLSMVQRTGIICKRKLSIDIAITGEGR